MRKTSDDDYEIVPVERKAPLLNSRKAEGWREIDIHAIRPIISNIDRDNKDFVRDLLNEHPEIKTIRVGEIVMQVEHICTETRMFRKHRNTEQRISVSTPRYEIERD